MSQGVKTRGTTAYLLPLLRVGIWMDGCKTLPPNCCNKSFFFFWPRVQTKHLFFSPFFFWKEKKEQQKKKELLKITQKQSLLERARFFLFVPPRYVSFEREMPFPIQACSIEPKKKFRSTNQKVPLAVVFSLFSQPPFSLNDLLSDDSDSLSAYYFFLCRVPSASGLSRKGSDTLRAFFLAFLCLVPSASGLSKKGSDTIFLLFFLSLKKP